MFKSKEFLSLEINEPRRYIRRRKSWNYVSKLRSMTVIQKFLSYRILATATFRDFQGRGQRTHLKHFRRWATWCIYRKMVGRKRRSKWREEEKEENPTEGNSTRHKGRNEGETYRDIHICPNISVLCIQGSCAREFSHRTIGPANVDVLHQQRENEKRSCQKIYCPPLRNQDRRLSTSFNPLP